MSGGIFNISTNDGEQDRMLMSAELPRRIQLVKEPKEGEEFFTKNTSEIISFEEFCNQMKQLEIK